LVGWPRDRPSRSRCNHVPIDHIPPGPGRFLEPGVFANGSFQRSDCQKLTFSFGQFRSLRPPRPGSTVCRCKAEICRAHRRNATGGADERARSRSLAIGADTTAALARCSTGCHDDRALRVATGRPCVRRQNHPGCGRGQVSTSAPCPSSIARYEYGALSQRQGISARGQEGRAGFRHHRRMRTDG
jgi:hypothetical protein